VRLTRFHLFLLGGLVLAIVGPVAFTQPDMGRFGGKGKGFGKRGGDPSQMFMMYSGGKPVINVSEVQVPERMARWMTTEQLREQMNAFLQKKGVTNGQMTLALYQEYSEESRRLMMERFRSGNFGRGPGMGPQPGGPGGGPGAGAGPAAPAMNPADIEAQAKELFTRLDTNKDGQLSIEEMQAARTAGTSRIYDERDRFDANKNGTIDLAEFTAYYRDQMTRRDSGGGWPGMYPTQEEPPPEEKRVVYRVGNLPKELLAAAPWFEKLDTDKDGQIGLYEWKASGKPVKEFLEMDINADGFVTAEELMRHLKLNKKDNKTSTTATASTTMPAPMRITPGGGGPGVGRDRGGRGRGGPRGGGDAGGGPGGGRRGPPGGGPGGGRGGRGGRGRGGPGGDTWGGAAGR
jgi:hypothetical protein